MKLQYLFLLSSLLFSAPIFTQTSYYQIDGNNCDAMGNSPEWGTSAINDPVNDSDAAGSDLVNYWYDYDSDTDLFCFAFERFSTQTNGPTATYIIYFDLDCDESTGYGDYGQGGEVAIGLEWKVNGPWEVIQFTNGSNGTEVLGNAFVGQSDCNDPSSVGQFAEFCFTLNDLIGSGYDPCSCNAISTPGVVTLAGGNITSQVKDYLDFLIDAEIQVNAPPVADGTVMPTDICLGDAIDYDGTTSFDTLPDDDIMTYVWDFNYDGVTIQENSTAPAGSYIYTSTGSYDVILQVEDTYGCTDEKLFTVNVVDEPIADYDLVFDPCNLTISYDGTISTDVNLPDNLLYSWDFGNGMTSTTATGSITYESCGLYFITLEVIDPDGLPGCNISTITQSINFDPIAPTITCPTISVGSCEIDSVAVYTTVEEFINAGGTVDDNCAIDGIQLIAEFFDNNLCGGTLTRTYMVTDLCGQTASCEQSVTIDDDTQPTMICPTPPQVMCSIADFPPYANYNEFIAAGGIIEDDCGINASSFSFLNELTDGGVCPEVITRSYSIEDNCGNAINCLQTIIVSDTIPPLLIAPPNASAICSFNEIDTYYSLEDFLAAGGQLSDNCGLDSTSFQFVEEISNNMTCPETVEKIYEIEDLCGNVSQASHIIIVDDMISPEITCPADLVTECSINEVIAYATLIQFENAGGSVSDNCQIQESSFRLVSQVTDSLSCPETFTRTYGISDICGNESYCQQIIVVDDITNPAMTCPANQTTSCSISEIPPYTSFTEYLNDGGIATDNCGLLENTFSLDSEISDNASCPETITRTYSIQDSCLNSITCSQIITINDEIDPVMTSPADISSACSITEILPYATLIQFENAGGVATDNCSINYSSFQFVSETSDNNTCPETITRIYSVADLCGNLTTSEQQYIINDVISPSFTSPGDLEGNCDADEFPAYDDYAEFIAAGGLADDNCQVDENSFGLQNESNNGLTCPEIITRVYEIADVCGNVSTFQQIVTIDDQEAPIMSCPSDLTAVCSIDEQESYTDYSAFIMAGGTVSDNCAINESSFTLQSETSNNATCPEIITRTYYIEDLCGNSITCEQNIVIDDSILPEMTCPSGLTAICSASEQVPYQNLAEFEGAGGSVSDNCGILESSFDLLSEVSDGNSCPETVTRTYIIEDLCGNSITCIQLLTIDDEEPPSMTCPSTISAVCSITEQPAYNSLVEFEGAGGIVGDNCEINDATFQLQSEVSDNATCPETVTRTYYVEDLCGNSVTCSQIVTINDDEAPSMTSPNDLDAVCAISEHAPYTDVSAFIGAGGIISDNCAINETTFALLSEISDGNSCPEIITRTYYVEDLCGNSITSEQIITINDTESPVLQNLSDLTGICDITEFPALGDFADFIAAGGTSSDNCTLVESSFQLVSESSDLMSCPEVFTRIYSIDDQCGNQSTFEQIITIDDQIAPIISCPGSLTAVCSITEQTAYLSLVEFENAGGIVSDNCGINEASFVLVSETSDNNTCPETISRVYSIEDLCGNISNCTQTIIINDDIVPDMTCPPSLTAICESSEQLPYSDLASFLTAGGSVSDNCGILDASFTLQSEISDGNTCPETITRTYYVEDLCGNPITCTQELVLNDTELPQLICPGDLTAVCDISEALSYVDLGSFLSAGGSATDNCMINDASFILQSEVSDNNSCPETVTRVYYVEDLCGNGTTCVQEIVINDTELPTMNCPADLTTSCEIAETPAYISYLEFQNAGGSAMDNCSINEGTFTLQSEISDNGNCPEIVSRTYYVEDLCGNSITCEQLITIHDQEAPIISNPGDLMGSCDIIELPLYGDYNEFISAGGTAADNCGIVESSFALQSETSDNSVCPETYTRIYQIADLCGNIATFEQVIVIDDEILPEMTCPPNLSAVCDITEQPAYTLLSEFEAAGGVVTDNCGIDILSFTLVSENSDGNTCPETVTRTYSILDNCGNEITCEQQILIQDIENPILTCPGALVAICEASEHPSYTNLAEFEAAGGTVLDNCEINVSSFSLQSEVSDGNTCPEVITRTYYIEDLCGNSATCEQVITLNDEELPVISCPSDLVAVCDISEQPEYTSIADFESAGGSVSDNCAIESSSFIMLSETSDGNLCPETISRVYYIEDLCGNSSTCLQQIVINDEELPVLNCPGDLNAVCSIDEQPAYSTLVDFETAGGSATDNCEINAMSFALQSETTDMANCPETVTRIYYVEDLCGNGITCEQVIVVNDEELPTITGLQDLVGFCSIDEFPIYADFNDFINAGGSASDNCTLIESSFKLDEEVSDGGVCPEIFTRTYTITDQCGNISSIEQNITIDDIELPTINCPSALSAICDISEVPAYLSLVDFEAAGGNVSDNCGINNASFSLQSETSDGNICPEIVTRIYVIEDNCGNANTCEQEIVIQDDEDPTMICPGELAAICDVSEQPAYASLADFISAGGAVNDNCSINDQSFSLISEVSDGNSCPETITRTYRIEDQCGNQITCTQNIVINDDELPVLSCPANLTASCSADEQIPYSSLVEFISAGGSATDNCQIVDVSFMLLTEFSDGNMCPEIVTRVYTISDACGNTATCEQLIEVHDTEAPLFEQIPDVSFSCSIDEYPPFDDLQSYLDAGFMVSDNCEIEETSFNLVSETSAGSGCSEIVTRIYEISDICGNVSTSSQEITIQDLELPLMNAPADDFYMCLEDMENAYSSYDEFVAAGGTASDNCGIDESSFTLIGEENNGLVCPFIITREYQISDFCGNIISVMHVSTMQDNILPEITCPPTIQAICDISEVPAYDSFEEFVAAGGNATDNCGINPYSFTLTDQYSDNSTCPETVTRVYRIKDICGNISTCTQEIVIKDEEDPIINCPANLVAVCSASEHLPYQNLSEFISEGGSASDNCGIDEASFTLVEEVSDGNGCPEVITRIYEVKDLCGNVAKCNQLVTLNDEESPVFTEAPALYSSCSIDNILPFESINKYKSSGGNVVDNCDLDINSFMMLTEESDGNQCPETVTRTYIVSDLCGNTATVLHQVIINDEIPPSLLCPITTNVGCSISDLPPYENYEAFLAEGGIANDNCEIDPLSFTLIDESSDGNTCPETITRTYIISDLCGNTATCEQLIFVNDIEAPFFSGPDVIVGQCSKEETPPYANIIEFVEAGGILTDNCQIDSSSFTLYDEYESDISCPKLDGRFYIVSDVCGNTATFVQSILIDDTIAPEMTCPSAEEGVCSVNEIIPYNNYNEFINAGGIVDENCELDENSFVYVGDEVVTNDCPKLIHRTYSIMDKCGNIGYCTQELRINDTIAPTLVAPANLYAKCELAEKPAYTTLEELTNAGGGASDNCALNPSSFMLLDEYSNNQTCPELITRIYVISDKCGNTTTAEHRITINDIIEPEISCPAVVTDICSLENYQAAQNYDEFILAGGYISDNCAINIQSFELVSEDISETTCPQIIERVYYIEDICGNSSTCSQEIIVNDTEAPTITSCPPNLTLQCNSETNPLAIEQWLEGFHAVDNCGIAELSNNYMDPTGPCDGVGETVVEFFATDLCENTVFCSATLTIIDTIAPTSDELVDILIDSFSQIPNIDISVVTGVSDDCDYFPTVNWVSDEFEENGSCAGNALTLIRTYEIVDCSGNSTTVTQNITMEDDPIVIASTNENIICKGDNSGSISISVTGGSPDYSFDWNNDDYDGMTDLTELVAGQYEVTVTDSEGCTKSKSIIVSEPNEALNVVILPNNPVICEGTSIVLSTNVTPNNENISYTWLFENEEFTQEEFEASQAGIYSIEIEDENGCTSVDNIELSIIESVIIDPVGPLNGCESVTLVEITGANLSGNEAYFTQPNGNGTSFSAGDIISSNTILYIYDETGSTPNCFDEIIVEINLNGGAEIDNPGDQIVCESYILPQITGLGLSDNVAYFTQTQGEGEMLNAGDIISENITIFIFDQGENCDTEVAFNITIIDKPVLDPVEDVTACDSYVLPIITGDNLTGTEGYYSAENGGGIKYEVGEVIFASITLYIFDGGSSCFDQKTLNVTINSTPNLSVFEDALVCNFYVLEPIEGTDLTGNQKYFSESGGQGISYEIGDTIFNDATLFVYDIVTTCFDEFSFDITIVETPDVFPLDDVLTCDFYTLPQITGSNLTGNESYWTGPNGIGSMFEAGDIISSNQIIYIYDVAGSCSDQESFTVTISGAPDLDPVDEISTCGIAILPEITGINIGTSAAYFTEMNGEGIQYEVGDTIYLSTQLFVYFQAGSCEDEEPVSIEILESPVIDNLDDLEGCDAILLPIITGENLSGNEAYYTEPDGNGTKYVSGDIIESSIDLYVFDANSICQYEIEISIDITISPLLDEIEDVQACNSFILPNIDGVNLIDPKFYTESGGNGDVYLTGDNINTSLQLYAFDINSGCSSEVVFEIEILEVPVIYDPNDVTVCDLYILPEIEGEFLTGNESYYTETNGNGDIYQAGDEITSSITLFIYDSNASCFDEKDIEIEVTTSPELAEVEEVVVCDSYVLPEIQGENLSGNEVYYQFENGNGLQYSVGDVITNSINLFIYDEVNTCSDEQALVIEIIATPIIDNPGDQTVCAIYTLEEITGSNLTENVGYFSEPDGSGQAYEVGESFTETTSFYIFDNNQICQDQVSFTVTILDGPNVNDLPDVQVCEQFVLPSIEGVNLTSDANYYSGPNGTGSTYQEGEVITENTTIYIYDAVVDCSDEEVFSIQITGFPEIENQIPTVVCDFYVLPTILGTNLSGNQQYFTQANANGDTLFAGDTIFESTSIYLYDSYDDCFDEELLDITIIPSPLITPIEDIVVCDQYILGEIVGDNLTNPVYSTGPAGTGDILPIGHVIDEAMTVYVFDQNESCVDGTSFAVIISPAPVLNEVLNVNSCEYMILPTITGLNLSGNESYFTQPNGDGVQYQGGDTIFISGDFYIFDAVGTCNDEIAFSINILDTPVLDPVENITVCDFYVLPEFSGINLGEVTILVNNIEQESGYTITEPSTVTVSAINGICTDEIVFEVNFSGVPLIDPLLEVSSCDFVILDDITGENLTGSEAYFTQTNGSGTMYAPGDTIFESIELFAYVIAGGCSDEKVFQVSIFTTPELANPSDVEVCDFFVLPEIQGSDLNNPKYFSLAGGNGIEFVVGDQISEATTIYIYDENNGCIAESSFNITTGIQPSASINGNQTICIDEGETAFVTIDVSGSFPVFVDLYLDGNLEENLEITQTSTEYEVTQVGVYTIANLTTADNCMGSTEGTATITGVNSIIVSETTIICSETTDSYTISFTISGGIPNSYTVNGELVNASGELPFEYSETFSEGSGSFSFEIQDENGCNVVIIEGAEPNCDCQTQIGEITNEAMAFCDIDETIIINYDDSNQVLDADDILLFILHDGNVNNIGNIISSNTTGTFTYIANQMQLDVEYFVSAVVGNQGNPIDLEDPCLGVSSVSVIFYSIPTAKIEGNQENCLNSEINVPITFTGSSPFTISYELNGDIIIVENIVDNPFLISFNLTEETTIELLTVEGTQCAGQASGMVEVNIIDELFADVVPTVQICNLFLKGSIINFTDLVVDGMTNGEWFDIENSGSSGPFTARNFDGVEPGFYAFTYTIGLGSDCGELSYEVIVEVVACSCPVVSVVSPDPICVGSNISLDDFVLGDAGAWTLVNNSNPDFTIDENNVLSTSGATGGELTLNFTLYEIDPDCPFDTIITLVVDGIAYAGEDMGEVICQSDFGLIFLDNYLNPLATSGKWEIPTNLELYFDAVENTFDVSQLATGEYTLLFVTTSPYGICGQDEATMTVEVLEKPSAVIADVAELSCEIPNTIIDASSSVSQNGHTYQWNTVDGNIVSTDTVPMISVNKPGIYEILITDVVTGCSSTSEVVVEGTPDFVIADAGEDKMLTCAEVFVMLDASASSQGDYLYQWLDGNGNVIEGANNTLLEIDSSGTYIFQVMNLLTGCTNTDTVEVSAIINYPIADVQAPEMLTCDIPSIILDGSSSTSNEFVSYQWVNEQGVIISEDSLHIEVNQEGMYLLHIIDTTNMCEAIDTVYVLANNSLPEVETSSDQIIDCILTEATVSAEISTDSVSYNWFDQTGELLEETALTFETSTAGTYTIIVTNETNGCIAEESIHIGLDTLPIEVELLVDNPCDNPFGTISANVLSESSNVTFMLSNGVENITGIFNNLPPGEYELIAMGDNGCSYEVSTQLFATVDLNLDAGDDYEIDLGETVQLNAETSIPDSMISELFWAPEDGTLDCIYCYDPIATPYYTTEYTVTMEDIYGCIISDNIEIRVDRRTKVYAPNAFSPNNDGVNDMWTLFSASNIDIINEIRIYNRWGEHVWENFNIETGDTSEGWDGTFKGETSNPGVFAWYAIVTLIDGTQETIKGDVTIVK